MASHLKGIFLMLKMPFESQQVKIKRVKLKALAIANGVAVIQSGVVNSKMPSRAGGKEWICTGGVW